MYFACAACEIYGFGAAYLVSKSFFVPALASSVTCGLLLLDLLTTATSSTSSVLFLCSSTSSNHHNGFGGFEIGSAFCVQKRYCEFLCSRPDG